MLRRVYLITSFALVSFGATASTSNPWQRWREELQRLCPSHHVEWAAGQAYDELIGAYATSLPAKQSKRLKRVAAYQRDCRNETAGFGCEMDAYLRAAQTLGQLHDMAAFGCREVRCEEPGSCSRFPHEARSASPR